MPLDDLNPRRVHLGGPITFLDDFEYEASATITPGMLVERHKDTTLKWRPHNTDSEQVSLYVALDRPENNKSISDDYASGDVPKVGAMGVGTVFYGIIPSGQDISLGEFLQSNGDGKLKTASATTATANVAKFQSLDEVGSVTEDTRLRVEVIQ